MIEKLKKIGISGIVLKWFESYLSNRRQRVKLDNIFSDEIRNENSVPQGSKLGPILFLIYVNDMIPLIRNLSGTCRLFADVTEIYFAIKNLEEIKTKLNLSLSVLYDWLLKNKMEINVKKTVYILIHDNKKNYVRGSCNIKFKDHIITEVKKTKYLGIIIDDNLTFKDNATEVINKVAKKINIMYRLGNSISSYS